MEQTAYERLRRFFSPRSVAVVGASAKNQWFGNLVGYGRRFGTAVPFFPVNPGAAEIAGIRALPSIEHLPEGGIDFAVVMVKSEAVPASVEKLLHKGVRNILLISSGFAETGAEGQARQEQLKRFCKDNHILLMGPNCLGFMNFSDRVNVFAGGSVEGELRQGPIGLVGQSGASSEIIASKLLRKSLGISLYTTTGNEAVITAEDCMDYLVHDTRTRVITGFMEGFRNIGRMKEIAREAALKQKPIVLLKVGRSERGMHAARSHTGALAGNDAVMDAFFRQYGIIRVESIEELVETASVFSRCPLPQGGRLGICTLSGGLCGLYADLCSRCGIEVPRLSERTVAALKSVLPDFAQPDNPLDVTGSGFLQGMGDILKILLDDENLDMIATLSFAPASDGDALMHGFNQGLFPVARSANKPVIALSFREMTDYARRHYGENSIYFIEHPQDSFKALSHLIRYAEFQKGLARERFGQTLDSPAPITTG
ncbi:MAG: CoA-binding protein [Desulfomonilia bacterium]|jgi:acyl-CoA synthetase (NDP forming)|nr:CoA-binding protein [Deltaproteobacteria bacterium]MDX9761449.1 CoA-binding protein [Desulfomonilia bacterium]HPW68794.1 CoA-binding protein [Deltaproteobacteria bacterium]